MENTQMLPSQINAEYANDTFAPNNGLDAGIEKMRLAGMPELAQRVFQHHYMQLAAGTSGFVSEDEIDRVEDPGLYGALSARHLHLGRNALQRTAILKLNGGLGTTMGLNGPKSLLTAKNNLSFLEIITRQVAHSRREFGAKLPLIFLNSFNTHEQTLSALDQQANDEVGTSMALMQHQIPRLWRETLTPAKWPIDSTKEWCPPGHGDLFASLVTSQLLPTMLADGYEYLFVSNSDNLGAVIDPRVLGYAVAEQSPFVMEVARRTKSDRKGGHLARQSNGQLCLRESAQCHPDEQEKFMDIDYHRFFNTNNLWIHLPTLQRLLQKHDGILPLPLIRNRKRVDADRSDSPHVYQLETAVGSAIGLFEGARALSVPRSRFVPVKSNEDLKRLRSNAYRLSDGYRLEATPLPRHKIPHGRQMAFESEAAAAKQVFGTMT
jgi:UTP--glucose-1-phosphate uridylyltransferase